MDVAADPSADASDDEAEPEADTAAAGKAIFNYLATQTEPVEQQMIHEAVPGRKSTQVQALGQLVADHNVIRTGTGRKGDPYRYRNAVPNLQETAGTASELIY